MRKLHEKFIAVMLSFIFLLLNFNNTSLATEITKEDYMAPYISMFEQYVEKEGIDVQIGDIDLLYDTCKELSLAEWKNRLDDRFEEFKLILENDKTITLQRDNNILFRSSDSDFDDGVPGVSTTSLYNSINYGVPGVSSTDSSGYVYLKPLSRSNNNDNNIKPFSSMYNFYDTFTGYMNSVYRYKITVNGTIVNEGISKVFNSVTWQAWNFPGENYFHVTHFINTINVGDSASTDAIGVLKTAEGFTLTMQITMSYKINAYDYNG